MIFITLPAIPDDGKKPEEKHMLSEGICLGSRLHHSKGAVWFSRAHKG